MTGTLPAPARTSADDGPVTDVLVIGAGFAGLYALLHARRSGLGVAGVEAGSDVGGTWYWNRYPGARCDVESIDYSYSFDPELQQQWRWRERYATQPEILSYIQHVAERYQVRDHFSFDQRICSLTRDGGVWTATSESGRRWRARHVIAAVGSLSAPHRPPIPGADSFAGEVYFTNSWPRTEPDLTGKRVGIIGTGSSGVQSVPLLAERAGQLTVFQRSANYSVPAFNRDIDDDEWADLLAGYAERRAVSAYSPAASPHASFSVNPDGLDQAGIERTLEAAWTMGGVLFGKALDGQTLHEDINRIAREFAEAKIAAVVNDPRIAKDLVPTDHPIGTKRICTDTNYYQTFNRDDVRLVNLRTDPIRTITPDGITCASGHHELDVLVYATGFDAMTGALTRMGIIGPRGDHFSQAWAEGPLTLLGMGVPGFPNLHIVNGPGSPSVLANMVLAAEQQVEWIVGLIQHCGPLSEVEPRADAARKWTAHGDDVAHQTLFVRANSWYMGANIAGKRRVFMPYIGGFGTYRRYCEQVADEGYAGYVFTTTS